MSNTNDTIPSHVSHLSRAETAGVGRFGGMNRPQAGQSADVRQFPSREYVAGSRNDAPRGDGAKKPFVAKGHDAQLQEAQFGRLAVRISLVSGGVVRGTIVKRDKFTITLRHNVAPADASGEVPEWSGQDEIFYKHAIEGVLIKRVNDSQE